MFYVQNKCFTFKTNVLLSKQMFYFQNKCFTFKTNVSVSKQMFYFQNRCLNVKTNVLVSFLYLESYMTYRTFEMGKMADKFCSACGQKYEPKDTVKFCFQCGSSLAGLSSLPSTSVLTSNTTMSLESFKHRKETARSSLFSLIKRDNQTN